MKSKTTERKIAFENTLQEYFKQSDFDPKQDTPKTDLSFIKNGLYYSIRCLWFKDGYIEARVIVNTVNPRIKSYEDNVAQKCWVNYRTPYARTTHNRITPAFVVSEYQYQTSKAQYCLYCDCSCKNVHSGHRKTLKHQTNVAKFILDLAVRATLPESVIKEIMSYTGY